MNYRAARCGVSEQRKLPIVPRRFCASVVLFAPLTQYSAVSCGEITALQILYNRPTKAPLKFEDLKALADTLQAPPHLWTESQLWQAYGALDQAKVKGKSTKRILTDLVSLVRYAMPQENELVPYPERVMAGMDGATRSFFPSLAHGG